MYVDHTMRMLSIFSFILSLFDIKGEGHERDVLVYFQGIFSMQEIP